MLKQNRKQVLCLALATAAFILLAIGAPGCSTDVKTPEPTPPAPTYTGPAFLHGTVGSQATVRGMEPQLVSGFGLVVGLPDTGSTSAPAALRQALIQEMRRRGVGSLEMRKIMPATPDQILASGKVAVVAIEGFLPPGASRGTHFDVLVSALPQTETTSLEGGRIWWPTDLSVGGTDPEMHFSRKLGAATGTMYLNPYDTSAEKPGEMHPERNRQAVSLAGGVVTADRQIEIYLNRPSGNLSRLIANRINERFHHEKATQTFDTATPISDQLIRVNVPMRYAQRPEVLMNLISHLYLQRGPEFETKKAEGMVALLATEPRYAADVTMVLQTLGKMALPVMRAQYESPLMHLRLSVLEAGASLGDELAVPSLEALSKSSDVAVRRRVADILVFLPRSIDGARVLKKLLDDDDLTVRIAAYRTATRIGDPNMIQQSVMGEGEEFKFILDLIPSDKPLIYISQTEVPRVAVFGLNLGFKTPTIAKLWDNHLMLRVIEPNKPVSVFYQPLGEIDGKTNQIAPTLANLVYLMAHRPTKDNADGLDLTYSQVVNAIFTLQKTGQIQAPLEIQVNEMAQIIAKVRDNPLGNLRPETGGPETKPVDVPEKAE